MSQFIQTSYLQEPAIGVEGQRTMVRASDKISSKVNANHKIVSIAVTAANSTVYSVTINNTVFTYTSDGSGTTAEITVGLASAINAGSQPVRASGVDTPLIVEAASDLPNFTHAVGSNLVATVTTAGQEIPCGVFVCMDEGNTDEQAARLPVATGDVTGGKALGVVLNDLAKVEYAVNGKQTYHFSAMFPVLEDGVVFVKVEEAVSKGDAAFVRFAAGTGTQLGAFRKTADSASAVALPGAFYESDAAAGALVKVRVRR